MSDNIPIDPQLLTNDPSLRFLERIRTNPRATTSPPVNDSPSSDADDADLPPGPSPPSVSTNSLSGFNRLIKRHKKLSTESEADWDDFCSNPSFEERLGMLFVATLQTRDQVKQLVQSQADTWVISEELKKSVRVYTQSFILSPTTTSYRGNSADHILKAMRELNVQDIPPEQEVTRVRSVLQVIRTNLTAYRNIVKEKIKGSIDASSPVRNIADLVHSIISHTPVQPTLQLYMRIAFLRWHVVEYPDLGETEWWPRVDKTMETWRTSSKDAAGISNAFYELYLDDKEKFGDPANTSHQVIEPRDVTSFINTINKHAANIQGKRVSKKRKVCED